MGTGSRGTSHAIPKAEEAKAREIMIKVAK